MVDIQHFVFVENAFWLFLFSFCCGFACPAQQKSLNLHVGFFFLLLSCYLCNCLIVATNAQSATIEK